MLADVEPLHPHVHTYLGATAVALVSALLGKPACEWALRAWNARLSPAQARWLGVEPAIRVTAVWSGAIIGAYSHIVFDSIMHADLQPLAPFSSGNGLLHFIPIEDLHMLCIVLGVLGLAVLVVLRWRNLQ